MSQIIDYLTTGWFAFPKFSFTIVLVLAFVYSTLLLIFNFLGRILARCLRSWNIMLRGYPKGPIDADGDYHVEKSEEFKMLYTSFENRLNTLESKRGDL